ncbi:MAG TPA: winged helix DNA-binding domain-containing protein [Actinomycetota bacterium]
MSLRREAVIALMLHKQHLAVGSTGEEVLPVLDDLLGLHATVALSPYLQLRARMRTFAPDQLDALLDEGRAAKLACMRRTLFIESAELVPLVFAATRGLTVRDRERFLAAYGLTPRRYERVAERVARALAEHTLDASELRDAIAAREPLSPVIIVMCDQARLVRWKGSGGWQSARPRYRRFEEALPDVRLDTWEEHTAARALVECYVRRYGPVSESDIAWWTGLRKTTVRDALATSTNLVQATIEGLDGVFLIHEADVDPAQRPAASPTGQVSLLPVLDPYLQGYRNRERCVDPPLLPFVVDRGGNTTSVILIDGRAAGVWDFVAKPSPEVRLFFFDSLDAQTRRRVRTLAAELAGFLTDHPVPVVERNRMTPLTQRTAGRFLSPLKDPH